VKGTRQNFHEKYQNIRIKFTRNVRKCTKTHRINNLLTRSQNFFVHARPKTQPPIVRRHRQVEKLQSMIAEHEYPSSMIQRQSHIKCIMQIWLHTMFVTQSHARCNDDTGRNCSFSLIAYYEHLMRTNINTDGLWSLETCSTSVYCPLIFICIKNKHILSDVANLRTRAETLRVWQNRNNIANIYL